MPSEKRTRQRAARDQKLEEQARLQRRRTTIRRVVVAVVIAAVVIGIIYLTKSSSKKSSSSSTTTTTASSTTTTQATGAQATANAAAVAAGCPSSPTQALQKPTWSSPPAMTIDTSKTYTAVVKTDVGSFTVTLDAKQAPTTVNSFVFLANKQFFNCMAFMRVIPGFMNQTGSPTQTNAGSSSGGGPGYTFASENSTPSGGYQAGDVAMANSGPDTNGSQFFVLAGPYNNPGYNLFGHVTAGMDVVQKINADGSQSGTPPTVTHRMLTVTISES
ncbi:MAG TPA: peptidylprolyl isomerase [Acidimicrobiales bacterium]|nr:peptidylprolyl isomerase [Acidimicrobiales bacterium]